MNTVSNENRGIATELLQEIVTAADAGSALMLGPQAVKNLRALLIDVLTIAASTPKTEAVAKCLLVANALATTPVCGAFKLRVGSHTIRELHAWLNELEATSEDTSLFGMAVWSNEDFNTNLKASEAQL